MVTPIPTFNRQRADRAFAAHAAMMWAEARDQALRDNPFWTMLRQDAFERFALELERAK